MEKQTGEVASPMMDRQSKILLAVFAIAVLLSIGVSFYKFMIARNYIIEAQVDCDPVIETCFIWECDPESEEEGEACTGNPEEDAWYYKVIRKNAMNIPLCDPNAEGCEPIVCMENEAECEYVSCEEDNEDGVACSNPEDFAEDSDAADIGGAGEDKGNEDVGAEEGTPVDNEASAAGDSSENTVPIQ